jgi:hypothetical protein
LIHGKYDCASQFIRDQCEAVILEGLSDDDQSVLVEDMIVGQYQKAFFFI